MVARSGIVTDVKGPVLPLPFFSQEDIKLAFKMALKFLVWLVSIGPLILALSSSSCRSQWASSTSWLAFLTLFESKVVEWATVTSSFKPVKVNTS